MPLVAVTPPRSSNQRDWPGREVAPIQSTIDALPNARVSRPGPSIVFRHTPPPARGWQREIHPARSRRSTFRAFHNRDTRTRVRADRTRPPSEPSDLRPMTGLVLRTDIGFDLYNPSRDHPLSVLTNQVLADQRSRHIERGTAEIGSVQDCVLGFTHHRIITVAPL